MLRILCLCLGAVCLAPAANAVTVNVTFSYGGETGTLPLVLTDPPLAQYDPDQLFLQHPVDGELTNANTIYHYDFTPAVVSVGGLEWSYIRMPSVAERASPPAIYTFIAPGGVLATGPFTPGASLALYGLLSSYDPVKNVFGPLLYTHSLDCVDTLCAVGSAARVRATVAGGDVSAVPVPPALALMLTGAGAFGFLRRRRRSHA